MKANFELTINRSSGVHNDECISIRVDDGTSGCRILEVNFELAEFMKILTGRCGITAEGDYYPDGPIGCTSERKEEILPRPKGYKPNDGEDQKIVAPFEIDGWKARMSDLHNHHRWAVNEKVTVMFNRFVRPDGTVWEPSE